MSEYLITRVVVELLMITERIKSEKRGMRIEEAKMDIHQRVLPWGLHFLGQLAVFPAYNQEIRNCWMRIMKYKCNVCFRMPDINSPFPFNTSSHHGFGNGGWSSCSARNWCGRD